MSGEQFTLDFKEQARQYSIEEGKWCRALIKTPRWAMGHNV